MKITSKWLLIMARFMPIGYWRMIRHAAKTDPALWDYPIKLKFCRGFRLRADLRESVYTGLYRFGYIPHQLGLDMLCMKVLRPGDIVFDVGANIGYTTLLFSALVGEKGKVVAVEPSRKSYDLLLRAIQERKNVVCLNLAASDQPGEIAFFVPKSLDLASCLPVSGADLARVQSDTVDRIADIHGAPDFVKIDVEGYEPNVFRGMTKTLRHDRRPILIFEALSAEAVKECVALLDELSNSGYAYYRVGGDDGALREDLAVGTNDYLALPEWASGRILPQ
jgi:FkbM family methyltransferase